MTLVAHTSPYPWPYDQVLEPGRTALLICGAGSAWSTRTPLDTGVEANIAELRGRANAAGIAVVLLDEAEPVVLGTAALPDLASPPLKPLPTESTLRSAGTDAFYGSALDSTLHRSGITHLFLAGRGFETCVHSTLRRANDRGYECLTISDACASLDPDIAGASVSSIEMSGGIFGAVGSTEHVCAALEHTQQQETP